MSVEACTTFCASYTYAGVEWAEECCKCQISSTILTSTYRVFHVDCANTIGSSGKATTASDCNMACNGDASESCGAGGKRDSARLSTTCTDCKHTDRINIYSQTVAAPSGPVTVPSVGLWKSLGCYTYVSTCTVPSCFFNASDRPFASDSTATRTLSYAPGLPSSNTIEVCTAACYSAGYHLAGAEYGAECYCGNSFENGGAPSALGDCNMACAGNSTEACGGPNRLNVRRQLNMCQPS